MKQAPLTMIAATLLLLLFVAAFPQEQQLNRKDQRQHEQMTEMMKDSAMVNMMMDHIASDKGMRMKMMGKMMHNAKADSAGMMQMSRMMTGDKKMHVTLTKLMDEQMLGGNSTAREILIKFNPGIQAAQISAFESEVGLQHIKTIPELEVRVYRITSSKSIKEAIAISEKKLFVKYAEPNSQYKALKNN